MSGETGKAAALQRAAGLFGVRSSSSPANRARKKTSPPFLNFSVTATGRGERAAVLGAGADQQIVRLACVVGGADLDRPSAPGRRGFALVRSSAERATRVSSLGFSSLRACSCGRAAGPATAAVFAGSVASGPLTQPSWAGSAAASFSGLAGSSVADSGAARATRRRALSLLSATGGGPERRRGAFVGAVVLVVNRLRPCRPGVRAQAGPGHRRRRSGGAAWIWTGAAGGSGDSLSAIIVAVWPWFEASAMWSSISVSITWSRAAARASAHDDRDQRAPVAMHGGQQIEAGGAGVAGLDAVDAVDAAEQMVVVADDLAGVLELVGREILEIFRESLLERAARGRSGRARW